MHSKFLVPFSSCMGLMCMIEALRDVSRGRRSSIGGSLLACLSAVTSCDEGLDLIADVSGQAACARECEKGAVAAVSNSPSERWTWVLF